MTSVVAMLSFADFGIGNGMLNAVAGAHGRNNASAIKEYVSSGLFVLSLIALAVMAVFVMLYRFVRGTRYSMLYRFRLDRTPDPRWPFLLFALYGHAIWRNSTCANGPANGLRGEPFGNALVVCFLWLVSSRRSKLKQVSHG